MSIPIKHHYLPEWYLKRWATEADPRVWVYRRPWRDLHVERAYPAETGYQKHLYAVPSRPDPKERQALESEFMSPLDFRASQALAYVQAHGERPSDPKLRDAWTRFLMSLLYRSPERIAWLRSFVIDHVDETMALIKESYDQNRGPEHPETFEEWNAQQASDLIEEAQATLVRTAIDSQKIGTHINSMRWSIAYLQEPRFGLLTSDNPLIMSDGLGHRDGFILLPLSPRELFMAVVSQEVRDAFAMQNPHVFERAMNDAVVRQAAQLVIGGTGMQRNFVDKRLGRDAKAEAGLFKRKTWNSPVIWPD